METKFNSRTLYLITDTRTGSSIVRPGDLLIGNGYPDREAVTIRVATRQEAEQGWQNPLHQGWKVQP